MKWLSKVWNWVIANPLVAGGVVGIIFLLIFFIMDGNGIKTQFIDRFTNEKEISIIKEKDKQIKELNSKIENIQDELRVSQKECITLKNKISSLEKQKTEIKKPKNIEEIKRRLRALGYEIK